MGNTLIKIDCADQRLIPANSPVIASGGLNEDRVEFTFCSLWDGFAKTAVFYRDANGSIYHVALENDACIIPHEVLSEEGWVYIGVFGTLDDVRRTSQILKYRIERGAITSGGLPSDPTSDIYAQYVEQVLRAETAANNAESAATSANAAADAANAAAENAGDVAKIKPDLTLYNAYNIAKAFGTFTNIPASSSSPSYGASLIWNEDKTVCTINGTPTGTAWTRFHNYSEGLSPMEPGGTYYFDVISSDKNTVYLAIYYSYNGALDSSNPVYVVSSKWVTIPENADGILIRVQCTKGNTYDNATLEVRIFNAYPNNKLTEMVEDVTVRAIKNYEILPGSDLNNLSGNQCVLLATPNVYEHAPFDLGLLYNLEFSTKLAAQYGYQFTTGAMYYRRKSTTWGDWRKVCDSVDGYRTGKSYVAFGDSITYGAVWNVENDGSAYHRAKTEWRIPARIALAVGMQDNYANEGVSNIGYVKQVDGVNLVDKITSYDFTDVGLVTIMGGANDKTTIALGTHSAEANDGTICGAIKAIIDYLRTNYPRTQVVIIQPTPSSVAPPYDVWSEQRGGGWSMNDFDSEVSQLCHDNHVGYANWWECGYCDKWNEINVGYSSGTGPNYTHPVNDEDYALIGDFIAGKVSALFKSAN